MAKVITKNSFTPGSAPSGLSAGEMAVNVADKKLFVGNAVGGVVTLHDQNAIVTSINGATGAITNVARTNEGNTFSVRQVMNAGFTSAGGNFTKGITFSPIVGNSIVFDDIAESGITLLHISPNVAAAGKFFTLRSEEQNALIPSPAEIQLSGGDSDNTPGFINLNGEYIYSTGVFVSPFLSAPSIYGYITLPLSETIRNITDGSIDLMPSGSCANHFGLRVDTTSWGYGTRLYSVRGSDNNLTAGSFLFMNGCVINNDVDLGFNSSYSSRIRHTTTGNDTFQIIVTNDASHSGAVAIINQQGVGVVGRSPGITHTNPNLYVYSADHTDANDFIRFEHNQTNANIVSGTGGIVLQPQNSLLSVIGGLTASGATFTGNISAPNIQYRTNIGCNNIMITDNPTTPDIVINPVGMVSNSTSNTASFGPTGSYMLLLLPYLFDRGVTISRIATIQGSSSSGHTGSLLFAIYDTNPSTGLPFTLKYASAETNITTTSFQRYAATPSVKLDQGTYWMGFLLNHPSGKTSAQWSWGIVAGNYSPWEAYANGSRYFNNGNMSHLRYRFSGMTLGAVGLTLTHGFTSALTNNTHPAIGWGTSEIKDSQRTPYMAISVIQ